MPDYGQVWTPYATAGWAPYRDGRWVWEPFYGWTWVSYEPWGWAPYHYGRWFFYGSSWCWWPGPLSVYPAYYPVWAPAYVSFFGFVTRTSSSSQETQRTGSGLGGAGLPSRSCWIIITIPNRRMADFRVYQKQKQDDLTAPPAGDRFAHGPGAKVPGNLWSG